MEASEKTLRGFLATPKALITGSVIVASLAIVLVWLMESDTVAEELQAELSPRDKAIRAIANRGPAAQRSPEEELLARVIESKFESPDEVAVGNFLKDFPRMAEQLRSVKFGELRLLKRGYQATWITATAPTHHSRTARLRFVRSQGVWKLENLQIQDAAP